MTAPSDGAIVIHAGTPDPAYKPRLRAIVRWYVPDLIIAVWLGAIAGSLTRGCM